MSFNKKTNKTIYLLTSALTLFIYSQTSSAEDGMCSAISKFVSQTSLKEVILTVNYSFGINGKDPKLKISAIKEPAV